MRGRKEDSTRDPGGDVQRMRERRPVPVASERSAWKNQLPLQTAFVLLSTFLVCINAQELEGNECITASNERGICKPFRECEQALSLLATGVRPKICSFVRDVPVVCCKRDHPKPPRPTPQKGSSSRPQQPSRPRRRISEMKCDEYSDIVRDRVQGLPLVLEPEPISVDVANCPHTGVQLIVGGEETRPGEFPHMTAIGYQQRESSPVAWDCGGSLISELYVLTAAHCAHTRKGRPVVVRIGELNLLRGNERAFHPPGYLGTAEAASSGDYRVISVIKHPNYRPPAKYHDIALLKLEDPVRKFTSLVRPACLHTQPTIRANAATATGWGRIDFAESPSDVLLKVSLNIIDSNTCNNLYLSDQKTNKLPQGIVGSMMCAGELRGGKDTCQGDSGGPIQVQDENNKCIHYIIGVTSFGKLCAAPNAPGVYTRVSSYVSWIESIVWPSG